MTDLRRLYGTAEPPVVPEEVTLGRIAFALTPDGLRNIRRDGVEVIRAVTYPVRDRDWGTLAPQIEGMTRTPVADGMVLDWRAVFTCDGAALVVAMQVQVTPDSVTLTATATPDRPFVTNRAGFTVLHPVGVSGLPLTIGHTDGSKAQAMFPDLPDPWQPFKDIRSLTHTQDGITTTCIMTGDTFEMEDQRNWSDASFKTYVRPLALPWPYEITAPMTLSVALRFAGKATACPQTATVPIRTGDMTEIPLPELALVLTPQEAREAAQDPAALRAIAPQRITCHLDATLGSLDLAAFAALQAVFPAAYDLEYAALCEGDLTGEFNALAERITTSGLRPASLMVCPAVDRQSTPPGSVWPDCPPLAEVYAAAKDALPDLPLGGGMMSYFTELNRKRPPTAALDYVTHGTNPIVHAADDRSIMQTLTTLPYILRGGQAIAGQAGYRLGLSSIPMRQNPYGARTMDNPTGTRLCMAACDPRHHAAFGAAFTLGYLAAIAPFGVRSWTPAALSGPRGVILPDGGLSPLGVLLRNLAGLAGRHIRQVDNPAPDRVAVLALRNATWLANLTPCKLDLTLDGGTQSLPPYATRRVSRDADTAPQSVPDARS